MNLYDEDKVIVLNSTDATKLNGTLNSSVIFSMNGLLKANSSIIHSHIQLVALQLPHSFYVINSYNNKLFYTLGSIFSITVPEGNYNAFNIMTTMQTLFLANGHSIIPTISRTTGKITYTGTSNFTFNSLNSTILKVLGFLPSINTTSVSNVLVSPFPLNLLGTKRITVTSQHLATTAVKSMNLKTQTESILATVYIDDAPFGLIANPNTTNVNHLLNVKVIDNIDLRFTDEDGNLINFNNQEWTMKLKISSTYELITPSKSTFEGLTQQAPITSPPNNTTVQQIPDIPMTQDSDLDLLLYKAKQPIPQN